MFLTRNGRGRYVVVDIDDRDRVEASRALAAELDQGSVSASEGTRSLAEARAHLAELVLHAEA